MVEYLDKDAVLELVKSCISEFDEFMSDTKLCKPGTFESACAPVRRGDHVYLYDKIAKMPRVSHGDTYNITINTYGESDVMERIRRSIARLNY